MRNWQALDQPERAASARRWFHASRRKRWDGVVLGAVVAGAAYACACALLSLLLLALT